MDAHQMYGRRLDPNRGFDVEDRHLSIAGVPRRYRDCYLDKIPNVPYKNELKNWAFEIFDNLNSGRGLLLYGDFGTGKTGGAISVLIEALHVGSYAYFVRCHDIPDIYRSRGNDDVRKKIEKIQFLILDDMGAGRDDNDFNLSKTLFERIIRHRYDALLSTVITTNAPVSKFLTYYPAMASIIKSEYDVIRFSGVDWRNIGGDLCQV